MMTAMEMRSFVPGQDAATTAPLVSVILFCRNGRRTIRRSIESVLGQTYRNIQYVVQDGASTDGTLEILREYDDGMELVSAPDLGTNDAFWRALLRCRGEIIAVCLADEELLPHAIERAVEEFARDPNLGAVTGDAYFCNDQGTVFATHTGQDFNLLTYLFGDYCPNFAASFFRRSALANVALFDDRWKTGALDTVEFEIWCRLGIDHRVRYVPYVFAKYGMSEDQMSHKIERVLGELDSRLMIIEKHLFGKENFFGVDDELQRFIVHRQFEIVINHLTWNGRPHDAKKVRQRMRKVLGREASGKATAVDMQRALVASRQSRLAKMLRLLVPASVRKRIPLRYKVRAHYAIGAHLPSPSGTAARAQVERLVRAPMYHRVAEQYRMRGQVEQAWSMWRQTDILNDEHVASIAQQTLLKIPGITEAEIAQLQQNWANVYAQPNASKARPPFAFRTRRQDEKLTVAYHCGYLSADGSKAEVLPFIRKHDRLGFRIVGYSPHEEPDYVRRTFDEFHFTGRLTHAQFVDLVRASEVDVLVELSGLSYGHRFAAMASRCAPVQVHYMNHPGTIRVPNVDYVLADHISAPRACDIHYSERIYRLPGSLFGFDWDETVLPPIAPSPHLTNGYVTFGFFGHSEKLNGDNLALWANVLHAVPDAKMLIQGIFSRSHHAFIEKQFDWQGIPANRLILLPRCGWAELLRNYARVDITFDSWPYCGANTVSDSVYQGVPVVSLRGERFASAYGASQITACGLAHLVASSRDEFVSIAKALSGDSAQLVDLRKKLRQMVRQHGFGDSTAMARKLEFAYRAMYHEATSRFYSSPLQVASAHST